jgi:monofunctional biosynthetic peptidoglycan transglycosylase
MADSTHSASDTFLLLNFQAAEELGNWVIVNDGVMGGLSQGSMVLSDDNNAVFQGVVSLENNGGFTSTRTIPRAYALGGYDGVLLRVKGDGKRYQFRVRTNDRFDGISYRYHFGTEADKWITVRVPFAGCVPVFRGRILSDVKALAPKQIQQIGFLISDKQKGPFKLEIRRIEAYRMKAGSESD